MAKMTGSWSSLAPSTMSNGSSNAPRIKMNVRNFKTAVKNLLSNNEQSDVMHILSCYHKNRNVYYLAESIKNVLNTEEKRTIIPLLKQVIPHTDRPGFDQFTCDSTYVRPASSSRGSTISHQRTNDSGIGLNSAGPNSEAPSSSRNSRKYLQISQSQRASSMSDLSRKSSDKSGKRFSPGALGSAVRRKVRAVLTRRSSSSSVELKSSMQRRHNSETQLDKLGRNDERKKRFIENSSSYADSIRSSRLEQHQQDVIRINISKSKNQDLGFIIGGGAEVGSDLFVSHIDPKSPADKAGLTEGDVITRVNNTPMSSRVTHEAAAAFLKSKSNLILHVIPSGTRKFFLQQKGLSWRDMHGRPASPPSNAKNGHPKPVLDSRRSSLRLLSDGERKVHLVVKSKQDLGLMIRGGSEYGLGIYVTAVDENSAAENAGLKAGDLILEVNSTLLEGATHAEAVKIIKSSRILIMTVRYVGRIPQCQHVTAPSVISDGRSVQSSVVGKAVKSLAPERINENGVRSTFQRKMMNSKQMILPNMHTKSPTHAAATKVSSAMATLEETLLASPVWMSLTDAVRHTLRYYVKEYITGHVTADALILALSEILDNDEKFSLTSAVRECVLEKDLDRFDVLVLRREIEALRNRDQPCQASDTNSLGSKLSLNGSVKSDPNSAADSSNSVSSSAVNNSLNSNLVYQAKAEAAASCHELHSTPNNSLQGDLHPHTPKPNVSPVRPVNAPPPPPLPPKSTPTKPRRYYKCKVKPTRDEETETENTFTSSNEFTASSQGLQSSGTNTSNRSVSPFSVALEKHRSSNSGRIKSSNRPHAPLPDTDFFCDPVRTKVQNTPDSPVYASIMHPVKNPSLKMKKAAREKLNSTSVAINNHENSTSPTVAALSIPPPIVLSSSSSSLSESSSGSILPPEKLTLRPTTFATTANETIKRSPNYLVHADVHPDFKAHHLVAPKQDHFRSSTEVNRFATDSDSSDDYDVPKYPYLEDDVEMQKVVVFRTAATLGLTIEGGAGTKQPLPRVLSVQSGGCAQLCGRIRPGHVIHAVNGKALEGMNHKNVVRAIALAFKEKDRDSIELLLSGPYF